MGFCIGRNLKFSEISVVFKDFGICGCTKPGLEAFEG